MATDKSIDSLNLILFDNWPGIALDEFIPPGGFLGVTHHNVSSPGYDLGTKTLVWEDADNSAAGVDGWATFIYLKGLGDTEANPTCAARQVVTCTNAPSSTIPLYQVTNDKAQALQVNACSLAAYMLSVMTFTHAVTKYGWFWCGGIAPVGHVNAMGGAGNDYYCTGNVACGPVVASALSRDSIGLDAVGGDTEGRFGYSLAADA